MYSSDGLPHRTHDAPHDHPPYVSSLSSHSKGSRSAFGSDQYLNHHHSVSDGALSYFGSPVDSLQAPRWTPSLQRFDLGEFSTPAGGIYLALITYNRCSHELIQDMFVFVNMLHLFTA
jgi:hypothetical protein